MTENEIKKIVDQTVTDYIKNPIDLLNTNGNESPYIKWSQASYIRTINDTVKYF
jgi:hypothetical protein